MIRSSGEIGADYVHQTLLKSGLQARVKALLRRSEFAADPQLENEADTEIVIGDLHSSRCLLGSKATRGGQPIMVVLSP